MKKTKRLRFSKTSLMQYMDCPRRYYYDRHPDVPKRSDHPRVAGQLVHEMVETLYKKTKDPRPFYFKEKKGLLGYFWFRWQEEVKKLVAKKELVDDPEAVKKFGAVGTLCLSNYWKANINQPRPLQIEKVYRYKLPQIPPLIGIFDQLREVSVPWILKHRPNLIHEGKLLQEYDPVVIVDLKTEYASFDVERFKKPPTLMELVNFVFDMHNYDITALATALREENHETLHTLFYELGNRKRTETTLSDALKLQFELHESIQATLYTMLYELVKGKKPIAFCWYHLPSNKWFPTWRESRDYETLMGIIRHCKENIAANSFPKNVGKRCKSCDYLDFCREDRYFVVSLPEDPGEDPGKQAELVPNLIEKDPAKQLALRLGIRRKKEEKPPIVQPIQTAVLQELPWDGGLLTPPKAE